ncbi:MAG: hypothetical protein ACFCVF_06715 [Kineosporiaceae bacterium]
MVGVAAIEALTCLAFAVAVWAESAREQVSSGGVVEGVSAVVVAGAVVAMSVALARGQRRTAGGYAVIQVLVVLIGLSQAGSGVAAGRWGFAGAWLAAAVLGAAGLMALAALIRGAR